MSSDRAAAVTAFLATSGFGDARREPIPGDASTRSYERLHLPSGGVVMLMNAPPASESLPCRPDWTDAQRREAGWNAMARLAACSVEAYAATAGYLRGRGLSAPDVLALDAAAGLAVTEDFGGGVFARLIEDGADEALLYGAAIDVLARLHAEPPPTVLEGYGATWPLLDYDALALQAGADLFVDWYPRLKPQAALGADAVAQWRTLWSPIVARAAAGATVFAHRDFHAENLLWLPDRQGVARAGLIDFQDALRAHPSWDLHSLLQDARRDVSPELEAAMLARYLEQRPPMDREAFAADYASLAALNEARIIGIFARLITRDGKPRYGAFMPRMWGHLQRNLDNPRLAGLKAWFDRHVPMEARA